MSRNLQEQIRSLSQQLTQAQQDGNTELADDLQDEIWELEEQLNEETERLYDEQHNKQWH